MRSQLGSPLFWVLLGLLALMISTINPVAMIPSGAAAVGGVRPFNNSLHALSQGFALGSFLTYTFFASFMAGLSVIRDDEAGIGDLLHSSSLTPGEYLVGKFLGVCGALGLALLVHVALTIGFYQFTGVSEVGAAIGPFAIGNYLVPALLFAAPGILFTAALAFAVGTWARRPMAVYAVPTTLFLLTVMVFWTWAPSGLDPRMDRLLIALDPSSLRWLRQTLFAVDRGAEYYNSAPLAIDLPLIINRIWVAIVFPVAVLWLSIRRFGRVPGGRRGPMGADRHVATGSAHAPAAEPLFRPMAGLHMTQRPPGLWRGAAAVLRSELLELCNQPALYLFTAFLMFVVAEVAVTDSDAFGDPVRLTAGTLALQVMPVMTILACLFLLFTVVESMHREAATGFDSIFLSAPMPTGAILLGKSLASATVIAALTLTCGATCCLLLVMQDGWQVTVWPVALVFGAVLLPTLVLWSVFVTLVMTLTRHRAAALSVGLAALLLTGVQFGRGAMTWATDWPLWGALRWSDMGTFALNGGALLLNRIGAVALAGTFFAVAVQSFTRTERDRTAIVRRWRKGRLGARAVRLAAVAALPVAIAIVLAARVRDGFQGQAAKDRQSAYQRELAPEWDHVAPLSLTSLDLALDLVPQERRMRVTGEYTMVNRTGEPVLQAPFTLGDGTTEVVWRMNGHAVPATNRFGLHVLSLPTPIAPGDTVRVAFDYHGSVPNGITRNGGGVSHFILSSGVLLSTRDAGFVPVPGFVRNAGSDASEENSATTSPGDGFRTRVAVTAPTEFTVNAVGRKTAESNDGRTTTVVWESEGPVTAFNVLAGRWDVRRREGTAVFYHPAHERNVDHILSTLAAARRRYSEWFYPYPWEELRLSEVPNMETNATAFPTNISFSEGIGFLAGGSAGDGQAFSVTAHEAAHQWWGHILSAGDGPGTGLLIEGMANYATLLLHEAENGVDARLAFARWLEEGYINARRVDTERPLLETDEGRRSDEAVLSLKGAFVMWMLQEQLGRERMLAGLQAYVSEHARPRRDATPEELLETLRGFAPDSAAYQEFVDQWMTGLVLPEIQIRNATVAQASGGWRVSAELENVGTGTVSVELAAEAATPGSPGDGTRVADARTTVLLRPGTPQVVSWMVPFAPGRIVVDPDVTLLQLNRARATAALDRTK